VPWVNCKLKVTPKVSTKVYINYITYCFNAAQTPDSIAVMAYVSIVFQGKSGSNSRRKGSINGAAMEI